MTNCIPQSQQHIFGSIYFAVLPINFLHWVERHRHIRSRTSNGFSYSNWACYPNGKEIRPAPKCRVWRWEKVEAEPEPDPVPERRRLAPAARVCPCYRGTENTASTEPGLTHSVETLTLSTPAQSPWTAGVMRGGFVNRMPRPSIASLPTSPHLGKRKAWTGDTMGILNEWNKFSD